MKIHKIKISIQAAQSVRRAFGRPTRLSPTSLLRCSELTPHAALRFERPRDAMPHHFKTRPPCTICSVYHAHRLGLLVAHHQADPKTPPPSAVPGTCVDRRRLCLRESVRERSRVRVRERGACFGTAGDVGCKLLSTHTPTLKHPTVQARAPHRSLATSCRRRPCLGLSACSGAARACGVW